MAQLKDTVVSGSLRATDTIYTNKIQTSIIGAPTSSNGATFGVGTNGQVLKSNGTGVYWASDSGVTSVRVQATSPITSSTNTAQTGSLDTTIALANNYGDTKNPYASKTKNTVLAAPATADGVPLFRALVENDIPTISAAKASLGNVSNNANLNGATGAKGDIIYWSAANTPAHLTNTSSTTKHFLSITSQVPSWSAVSKGDVGLGNVENTALSTWGGSSNIKTVGTITTGTWQGTAIAASYIGSHSTDKLTSGTLGIARGGTGKATIAAYSIWYASAKDTLAEVTANTSSTKKFLRMTGTGSAGAAPAWDTVTKGDVGLGNVENTALSTWTGSNKITTVGTIGTGTWQGTAIGATYVGNLPASKITSGTFDAARIPSLSTDKLTSGTLPVERGGTGQTSIANIQAGKDGNGSTISSTYLKLSGGTLTGRLTTDKAINAAITGTYTAAVTSSPYKPVKWTFNTGSAPSDGDILTIKTPGVGHDYGVFISVDNGATYQPVARFNKYRLTTQYETGTYLTVIYSSSVVTNSVFPADGATARSNITGSWQILNDYDSGNDTTQLYAASGSSRSAETTANGGIGLHGYALQLMTANQTWSSVACTSGSTAANSGTTTTKVAATCNFLLDSPILYTSSNSYIAPGSSGNVNGYTALSFDLRYSTSGSYSLTVQRPVYLVGIPNNDNATFKLTSSNWWTQTLPTTNDGKIYIFIGLSNSTTGVYLYPHHPIFYHDGTRVRPYIPGISSVSNGKITGDITGNAVNVTGTVAVNHGGTGATSFTANSVIMSGSTTTAALTTRAITDNSSNADVTSSDTNLITGRTLYYQLAKKGYLTSHQTIKQDSVTGATANRYATCTIAAGTAAKTASITSGTFTLETGATVRVKFTYSNTVANPTLNINSTGAKSIYKFGTTRPGTTPEDSWDAGEVVTFVYDGAGWQMSSNPIMGLTTTQEDALLALIT